MDSQDFQHKELVGAHFVTHGEARLEKSWVSTFLLTEPRLTSVS